MLPNSLDPLWGIEVDVAQPDSHVRLVNFRVADEAALNALLNMIRGQEIER